MSERFTLDGDAALERRLSELCQKVRAGAERIVPAGEIEALLLGGGYGRGEGGVLKSANGDLPYNDLEFYVALRGNRLINERKYSHAFHHLGEELSADAGIEVEFKLSSLEKLQRERTTMFFYDLACGHKVVSGQPQVLANLKPDAKAIPLYEATRLLMNRCSGLLFSEERLRRETFTAEDADFVGRNQAKAQLAFGDVVLSAHGQYHWSCKERHERLQQFRENVPSLSQIRCHHALGVEFKLHPQKKTGGKENFLSLQNELVRLGEALWLWLESRRLQPFPSTKDYALSAVNKCPETSGLKNLLINARTFKTVGMSGKSRRYPRERILESLALLLWNPDCTKSPQLLRHLQSNLQTDATHFSDLVSAYQKLWQRFN